MLDAVGIAAPQLGMGKLGESEGMFPAGRLRCGEPDRLAKVFLFEEGPPGRESKLRPPNKQLGDCARQGRRGSALQEGLDGPEFLFLCSRLRCGRADPDEEVIDGFRSVRLVAERQCPAEHPEALAMGSL